MLRPLTATSDVADLARDVNWPVAAAARLYHQVGALFHFDRLRTAAGGLPSGDHYERMASRRLIEDMLTEQADLTRAVARAASPAAGADAQAANQAIEAWIGERAAEVEQARRTVEEIELAGDWTFAKLTIVNAALRELAASAR